MNRKEFILTVGLLPEWTVEFSVLRITTYIRPDIKTVVLPKSEFSRAHIIQLGTRFIGNETYSDGSMLITYEYILKLILKEIDNA